MSSPSEPKRRKVEQPSAKCVSEADVGITEYRNPDVAGFEGLLKQRYSDFQVNEIDLKGEITSLKSLENPEADKKEAPPAENSKPTVLEESEESRSLASIVGQDKIDELFSLANEATEPTKIKITGTEDKSVRTQIHVLIREAFAGRLDSRTGDGFILVAKVDKKAKKGRGGFGRAPRQAEFLHFTLYKENKDTVEAVGMMARMLHLPPKSITFAGTKDRRAVTSQRMCLRRGDANRLANMNNAFKGFIRLGDFAYEKHTIKLGDLRGNQFKIVLRDVKLASKDEIEAALASLRDNGFINYFGLQRFGTFSVSSHTIGRDILCQDYEKVVDSILSPQDATIEESKQAREIWATEHDASKALELMPRRCAAECAILGALKESPNALNAILRIPHSLKTMYVHAYQSYVWNRVASERIRLNASSVLAGDLVLAEADGEVQRARPVTDDEAASGKFTLYDVVLPSPGKDVLYPSNLEAFYESVMKEDGIDCHNMNHRIKEFSLFGSYRPLLAKPSEVSWCFRNYESDDDTVIYTDRERLETGKEFADEPTAASSDVKVALVLQLGLATSQYATMALREVMKQETSRNGKLYFK